MTSMTNRRWIYAVGGSHQWAIDFMAERTGMECNFVTSEADRYTSQPGQALAYMLAHSDEPTQ